MRIRTGSAATGRSLVNRVAAHVWLEYCLPAQAGSVTLVAYTLTAASGRKENDPVHVVLHGVRVHCELGRCTIVSSAACASTAGLLKKKIEQLLYRACLPALYGLHATQLAHRINWGRVLPSGKVQ